MNIIVSISHDYHMHTHTHCRSLTSHFSVLFTVTCCARVVLCLYIANKLISVRASNTLQPTLVVNEVWMYVRNVSFWLLPALKKRYSDWIWTVWLP